MSSGHRPARLVLLATILGVVFLALSAMLPATTVPSFAASSRTEISAGAPFTSANACTVSGALEGVDVSSLNGPIDWPKVKGAGKSFGYARVADGTSADATFPANYAGMKSAGLTAGAYLFFQPAQDPITQANLLVNTLRQVQFAPGDLAPTFDVELTGGQDSATIIANLQMAVNIVQTGLGVTPTIYTDFTFWNTSVGGSSAFATSPLFIGSWNTSCPTPLPRGWSTWAVWQYADNGNVAGINGVVDLDRSNGPTLPVYNPGNASPTSTPTATPTIGLSGTPRLVYLPAVVNTAVLSGW